MSSDEAAADAPDPEHAAFVRLPAGAASGGRDRVMSRAAREPRTRGTARCAVHGHPGFGPDDYLAGLGPQTAITVAGPCTAGLRERVPCGYRAPDGDAIEVCKDRMRELRKTPGPAPWNEKRHGSGACRAAAPMSLAQGRSGRVPGPPARGSRQE